MKLRVALLPNHLPTEGIAPDDIAVVIDTLRFTTTACQALHEDAASVWVASDESEVDQLISSNRQSEPGQHFRCGERFCRPIPGFDMGNSPLEYSRDKIADSHLFFTTTNGTRAVDAVGQANSILLAALVNRAAVARKLIHFYEATSWIVCAGTDGRVALEDVLAAGAIIDGLLQQAPPERSRTPKSPTGQSPNWDDDALWVAWHAWRSVVFKNTVERDLDTEYPNAEHRQNKSLHQRILASFGTAAGGRNLIDSGYQRDLEFAAQIDSIGTVPISSPQDWRCFTSD